MNSTATTNQTKRYTFREYQSIMYSYNMYMCRPMAMDIAMVQMYEADLDDYRKNAPDIVAEYVKWQESKRKNTKQTCPEQKPVVDKHAIYGHAELTDEQVKWLKIQYAKCRKDRNLTHKGSVEFICRHLADRLPGKVEHHFSLVCSAVSKRKVSELKANNRPAEDVQLTLFG